MWFCYFSYLNSNDIIFQNLHFIMKWVSGATSCVTFWSAVTITDIFIGIWYSWCKWQSQHECSVTQKLPKFFLKSLLSHTQPWYVGKFDLAPQRVPFSFPKAKAPRAWGLRICEVTSQLPIHIHITVIKDIDNCPFCKNNKQNHCDTSCVAGNQAEVKLISAHVCLLLFTERMNCVLCCGVCLWKLLW
jgi:hypothetical protein